MSGPEEATLLRARQAARRTSLQAAERLEDFVEHLFGRAYAQAEGSRREAAKQLGSALVAVSAVPRFAGE